MVGQKLYTPRARSLDRAVHCQTGTAKSIRGKKHETSPPQHETLLKLQPTPWLRPALTLETLSLELGGCHAHPGAMKMEPLPPPWVGAAAADRAASGEAGSKEMALTACAWMKG